jgi:hypothetical protein
MQATAEELSENYFCSISFAASQANSNIDGNMGVLSFNSS